MLEFDTVTTTQTYTIAVPYTETIDGVQKQLARQETRTRETPERVYKDTFKMVRTSVPSQSIELTDILGTPVPQDEVRQRLSQTTNIVLGSSAPSPFVINLLRKDALFLSIDKVDPNYHELPAVQGLSEKWTRPRGLITAAMAQLEPDSDRISVTLTRRKMVTESRTRMVKQADGSAAEQSYTVMVPIDESVQNLMDLSECDIATAGGAQIPLAEARERLAAPCRILFECEITDYLGSVLEPDTLVIRSKTTPAPTPTAE